MATLMKSSLIATLIVVLILAVFTVLGSSSSLAVTYAVTNNNDSGAGSLRDAITQANASAGLDVISIESGLGDISLVTALPPSTDPAGLTIDGPRGGTVIDGSGLGGSDIGLHFYTSTGVALTNVTVRELIVQNFPGDGIKVCGGDPADCDDALTATSIESVTSKDNGGDGIRVDGAPNAGSTVKDSVATGNAGRGVSLNAGNFLDLTNGTVQNTVANNNNFGINLNALGDNTGPVVTASTTNDNANVGININAVDDTVNAIVAGSTANGNNRGININAGGLLGNSDIVFSTVFGNTLQGVTLNSGGDNTDTTVRGLIANNNGGDGIRVSTNPSFDGTGAKIIENTAFNNGGHGISADVGGDIEGNTATANTGSGIYLERPAEVHFNRIFDNGTGLENMHASTIDAENNWWGCNEGPNTIDCDPTVGNVDSDPWLVLGIAASPVSIPEGGDSTVTGDVTMNSAADDTSASGNIPDDTQVAFETDLGSVGSTFIVKGTSAGIAQTVLTADGGPGTANISAELDNEMVTATVTVTEGTATPSPTPGPSVTATPTTTPSPSPSPTPSEAIALWADNDCDSDVDTVDVLKSLLHVADLPLSQTDPCFALGETVGVTIAGVSQNLFGDVDCDGDVDSVDALGTLRHIIDLPVSQEPGCPEIASNVLITA